MAGQSGEAKAAAMDGAGAIDLVHLDRATFGNRALAREVLILFDRQAETLLAAIAAATVDRARREAAHAIRGAALGIGAALVAEAAEDLETAEGNAVAAAAGRLAARIAAARLAIAEILAKA